MADKIYLGKGGEYGENLWLEKHKFDCGWYWAFGYIGNKNLHMHINALIDHPTGYNPDWTNVSEQFESTWLTQAQWWIVRDLFISAYALKECAAVYRHGGYQTDKAAPYRVINAERAEQINSDLEKLLNNIWDFLSEARAKVEK